MAEIEVDEEGRPLIVNPKGTIHSIVRCLIYLGDYTCRFGRIKATIPPDRFYLWETDEPVTLTFVRTDNVPRLDIYNGIDPIQRMEVVG